MTHDTVSYISVNKKMNDLLGNNFVKDFFRAWADYEQVEPVHGWIRKLSSKIGKKLNISEGNISSWINRGYIPDDRILQLAELDIPEELKALCLKCDKSRRDGLKPPRGSTILTGNIGLTGEREENSLEVDNDMKHELKEGLSLPDQIAVLNENWKMRKTIDRLKRIIDLYQQYIIPLDEPEERRQNYLELARQLGKESSVIPIRKQST